MLVLSRKPGEQILVPQCGLAVTVLAVEGTTVRLGIAAPAELAVYREEVWRRASGRAPARNARTTERPR
jgi:carbon storage regulator